MERGRLSKVRINGKVERERWMDGWREREGAKGGRDRLIKAKVQRNQS